MKNGIFSRFFHIKLREKFGKLRIPFDSKKWPTSWKTVSYKEYVRAEKIKLRRPTSLSPTLKSVLEKRHSTRSYRKETIALQKISTLLHYAIGKKKAVSPTRKDETIKRHYPSGGALYPLEVYIAIYNVSGIDPGLYHYNVRDHSLEKLGGKETSQNLKKVLGKKPTEWIGNVSFLIIVSAVWDRNFIKYQDFGYKIVLMETGHLIQNVQLVAEAIDLKYCSFIGFDEMEIDSILRIGDRRGENALYITAFGK